MKRRWKRIFAGLLAALTLCLCPCFAGAAPPENLPAVKTFRYATSGMCIEEFNRYQIKETARGRFVWIERHNDDHYVLPLTDEDMASFSALVQELGLAEWNGYHKIDRDVLDGARALSDEHPRLVGRRAPVHAAGRVRRPQWRNLLLRREPPLHGDVRLHLHADDRYRGHCVHD